MPFLCRVDAFLSSDQSRCAAKLLSAYTEGNVEEIKRVAQSSTISNLDHAVSRIILLAICSELHYASTCSDIDVS